ncbi:MAG: DUF1844 domain-containing protein [Candidatus Binataceae bacterium]
MDTPEEKGRGFKVDDRRRFSPEGELKPEHRQSEAEPVPAQQAPKAEAPPHQEEAGAHPQAHEALSEMTFSAFIVGLSTQALVHLGEIPDPVTGKPSRDLPGAQQLIDILGLLQQKTEGNLDADELHLLDTILFDLRMKYVEIARQGAR